MGDTILINNLFNGQYIKNSIGGEIINLYQADNGRYYVYINPYGKIDSKWDGRIEYVLFIRTVGNRLVKIIGKAKVKDHSPNQGQLQLGQACYPLQKAYIDEHGISYGGIALYELGSWSNYYVTFEVEGVYQAKQDIYLTLDKLQTNEKNVFYLEDIKRINNQSQKLYNHFYLLRPNYNQEDYKRFNMGDLYQEIKYSYIYDIIKDREGDFYMQEFKKLVKKHSSEYNNDLFELMDDRFVDQIRLKRAELNI